MTVPLKPVLNLAPAWLGDDGVRQIMAALGRGRALMVGGCVRAAIVGEDCGDIDIATTHLPEAASALLAGAGIKVVPTGLEHGTVTAVVNGTGYEITTLRRDVETDGRRAVVAFTDDWQVDAQRRDFTMNTLLMDVDGTVYDPTGMGVDDLRAGRVRFVGNAITRIEEDALRILRFFRFHARYGKGVPDAEGYAACGKLSGLIENLSRERITTEIEKLLPLRGAGASVMAMCKAGVLVDFFSRAFNQDLYDGLRLFAVENASDVVFPTLFYYSVCMNEVDKLDTKIGKYIVFSNTKKAQLKKCAEYISQPPESIVKSVYKYGHEMALCGAVLSFVFNEKKADMGAFQDIRQKVLSTPVPVLPLGAREIMRITGLGQGAELGKVLKKVECWWLDQDAKPDQQACLDYAKQAVGGQPYKNQPCV